MAEQIVPYSESLEPGSYIVRLVFESYASGERLDENVRGAFAAAMQRMQTNEPEVWLRINPGHITVKESIAPNQHQAQMAFEVSELGTETEIMAGTICGYVMSAFLDYFALRVSDIHVFKIVETTSPPSPPPSPLPNGEQPPPQPDQRKAILIGLGCLAGLWLLSYLGRG